MTTTPVILQALRDPGAMRSFGLATWDVLIRQARHANLLASLHALLDEMNALDQVPWPARNHLEWAHVVAKKHTQAVQWEVRQIRKALAEAEVPVILLKGAAYVMADLPPARGRLFSDIDIMVPKAKLDAVEAALMMHGWSGMQSSAYDQRYYRTWMHELPPMQHIKRMTIIDVHHAILPETAPLHPDSDMLYAASCFVDGGDGGDGVKVFSPIDMVLHSAVHLVHDGEMNNGLRDLLDIHLLLLRFGTVPGFWENLVPRAEILELSRPLFYALRYVSRLLHTPIPEEIMTASEAGQPSPLILAVMDQLFTRVLLPQHSSCSNWSRAFARHLLYLRANWLRMPPLLLARHLFYKAFIVPRS